MTQAQAPLVIGIGGGTGSGKTTVANVILARVGAERIAFLPHDAYYRDLADLPHAQRDVVNFDHPDSLETELLIRHLEGLKRGETVDIPVYDFTAHARTDRTTSIPPHPVILVEGILIFAEPGLRELFDVKIYVIHQYQTTVRPMHEEFVEPSKRFADVIIPEGGLNTVAMDMVVARLDGLLNRR